MMTAQALAVVFNDLFQGWQKTALRPSSNSVFPGVIYAGLDTDKYKYPIGSGRVTFNNKTSYMKAVSAAFIEIKTPRFRKKVQVIDLERFRYFLLRSVISGGPVPGGQPLLHVLPEARSLLLSGEELL